MSEIYQFQPPLTAEAVEEVLQVGFVAKDDPRFTSTEKSALDAVPGQLANKVDVVAGKQLSDENYTATEKSKLAGLESSRFKGTFVSEAALNSAYPTALPGDYADVDGGPGEDAARYIWDDSDDIWVKQQGESTSLTGSQIATLLFAEPDTNNFNDGYKSSLDGLAGALANKVDVVAGKQLSTEDYSTGEKDKLTNIQAGAQVNRAQSSEAQALAGTDTATDMSPLRVAQALAQERARRQLFESIKAKATYWADFTKNEFKVWESPYGQESKTLAQAVITDRDSDGTVNTPFGVQTRAAGIARIEYNPITADPLGLLSEGGATNLFLNNKYEGASGETLPTSWSSTESTGVTTTADSPRLAGAKRLTASGTTQRENIFQSVTLAAATTYTFSAYFAEGTAVNDNVLRVTTSDNPTGTLTLAGAAVTTPGIYRVTFTTSAGGLYAFRVGLGCSGNATGAVVHETPQLEVGSAASTVIPTSASSAARLADVNTADIPYNVDSGTIIAWVRYKYEPLSRSVVSLFTNNDNRFEIFLNTANSLQTRYVVGAAAGASSITAPLLPEGLIKAAFTFKKGASAKLAANGSIAGTAAASLSLPTGLDFCIGFGSFNQLRGVVALAAYVPAELSDAELIAVTGAGL